MASCSGPHVSLLQIVTRRPSAVCSLDVMAAQPSSYRRPAPELSGEPSLRDQELFRQIYPGLRRFAAVVAPFGSDPDDFVQEALSRTLATSKLGDLEDPGRYLQLVLVRLASNERRRIQREGSAFKRIQVEISAQEDDTATLMLLDELRPRDRVLLYLSVVEGLDTASVAKALDMKPSAVRMAKARALRQLNRLMGGER